MKDEIMQRITTNIEQMRFKCFLQMQSVGNAVHNTRVPLISLIPNIRTLITEDQYIDTLHSI
jgi:hypothetical protein